MPRRKRTTVETDSIQLPEPALDPKDREAQLIAAAEREAERRIIDRSASDALIIHYLREGTVRARLEREKLETEMALANAKRQAIESEQANSELYREAMEMFAHYAPRTGEVVIYD